jgi:hypothetical protein
MLRLLSAAKSQAVLVSPYVEASASVAIAGTIEPCTPEQTQL